MREGKTKVTKVRAHWQLRVELIESESINGRGLLSKLILSIVNPTTNSLPNKSEPLVGIFNPHYHI